LLLQQLLLLLRLLHLSLLLLHKQRLVRLMRLRCNGSSGAAEEARP
jgi:hypothetical protein